MSINACINVVIEVRVRALIQWGTGTVVEVEVNILKSSKFASRSAFRQGGQILGDIMYKVHNEVSTVT